MITQEKMTEQMQEVADADLQFQLAQDRALDQLQQSADEADE
jgi:hypothetical protein